MAKTIHPIKRENLVELTVRQLREGIEGGVWKPGEKIPSERELTEQLGVSHATVRQALQRLNAVGVLETRVGEGSFVKAPKPWNCLDALKPGSSLDQSAWGDVIEFRDMLEKYSARLAAERATEEEIRQLREIYSDMVAHADEPEVFGTLDAKFHLFLGTMTKNEMLMKSYDIVSGVLEKAIVYQIKEVGVGTGRGIYYHGKLLEAIAAGDGEEAYRLMDEHTQQLRENTFPVLGVLQRSSESGAAKGKN